MLARAVPETRLNLQTGSGRAGVRLLSNLQTGFGGSKYNKWVLLGFDSTFVFFVFVVDESAVY